MRADQLVAFRTDRATVATIDQLAWDAHVSRSEMIRRLIREAIDARKGQS